VIIIQHAEAFVKGAKKLNYLPTKIHLS